MPPAQVHRLSKTVQQSIMPVLRRLESLQRRGRRRGKERQTIGVVNALEGLPGISSLGVVGSRRESGQEPQTCERRRKNQEENSTGISRGVTADLPDAQRGRKKRRKRMDPSLERNPGLRSHSKISRTRRTRLAALSKMSFPSIRSIRHGGKPLKPNRRSTIFWLS